MHEKKIVNLDDAARSVSITVGGKVFEINRITMRMRAMYGEYLIFCGEYVTAVGKSQEGLETASAEELEKRSNDLSEKIEAYAIGKAKHISGLLSVILEKNNYEYDKNWWEENTDYSGMESFIVQAMKKDEEETAPRVTPKKALES